MVQVFYFAEGNAFIHHATVVDPSFETENISNVLKPSNVPDVNSTEHAIVMIRR